MVSEWQPIGTAPHGGPVLAWAPNWELPTWIVWHERHPRTERSGWDWWGEADGWYELANESKPTHWLPLPATPPLNGDDDGNR